MNAARRFFFSLTHGEDDCIQAAREANVMLLQQFQTYFPEYFVPSKTRYSLLVYAADRHSVPSAVPCLLSLGCCPDDLLHYSVCTGFDPLTYFLLTYGANLKSKSTYPWLSAYFGKEVRELVDEKTFKWIQKIDIDLQKQPFKNIFDLKVQLRQCNTYTLGEESQKQCQYWIEGIKKITHLGGGDFSYRKACQDAFIEHYNSLLCIKPLASERKDQSHDLRQPLLFIEGSEI